MYSLQLLSKLLRIETMILRQILQNVEWRIRVLKYQRTYLLHPALGQFSWNMQDKYLLIMYAILVHLLAFYLFIYAFILFLDRNYYKIIELVFIFVILEFYALVLVELWKVNKCFLDPSKRIKLCLNPSYSTWRQNCF